MATYEWKRETTDYKEYTCPIHKTVLLIGDRWTLFILREFLYGSKQQRFNQLLRSLKPISSRTLALKLKKLELHGLLSRRVIPGNVLGVLYTITEKGKSLKKALDQMGIWYRENNLSTG